MINRVAFVTGSTRGIGRGIADLLTENGYVVIYSGTGDARPADLPSNRRYIKCNIAEKGDRDDALQTIEREYGRLDLLVNNAGVAPLVRADVLETSEESFDRVMNINLRGTFFMCQTAANMMIRLKNVGESAHIVNITSVSAHVVSTNRAEYCVSKAGLSMVTQLFAARLAEHGIPVYEIQPGIIETDMTSVVKEKYTSLIEGGLTPIARMGTPNDVARMVLALSSGAFDFTTGQVVEAGGGFQIRRL